ncbi:unnamed protein product [Toxocara canis]|uniref:Uncharacterized protein n=1 Tax=Toxocara canis TaxID=6265 RepID=A0A183V3I9_TOXCA|nr:unnamed protein product [Toxocara canis]
MSGDDPDPKRPQGCKRCFVAGRVELRTHFHKMASHKVEEYSSSLYSSVKQEMVKQEKCAEQKLSSVDDWKTEMECKRKVRAALPNFNMVMDVAPPFDLDISSSELDSSSSSSFDEFYEIAASHNLPMDVVGTESGQLVEKQEQSNNNSGERIGAAD